jgi:hypothetical protein
VKIGDSLPKHTRPSSLTDTHPRIERLQNPTDHHWENDQRWKTDSQRSSSCLLIYLFGVEIHPFLPNG